jgi:hypothetical protein
VYRAVREYRTKYPAKAVIYSAEGENLGWAVFLAGGSLANIPVISDPRFLTAAASMTPTTANYMLAGPRGYILYATGNTTLGLAPGTYRVHRIHPDGQEEKNIDKITGGRTASLETQGTTIFWLEKQ